MASYICEGCRPHISIILSKQFLLSSLGNMIAQGMIDGLPKSSPLIKFAIRPRKRPIGAVIAIESPTEKVDNLFL